jgi:predicted O-methyltransferase YrrM
VRGVARARGILTGRGLHLGRRAAEWTLAVATRAVQAFRLLPPRIALFYVRALAVAVARRDRFTLASATRPDDLATLLKLAAGAHSVAEIGTGPGWSSIALALDDPQRRIVSFDVEPRPADRYARLVRQAVRDRIEFVLAEGAHGATSASEVDFVFIDSSHRRDETIETFEAWRPRVREGGAVAFHDYDNPQYPGVAEAVADLGLDGRIEGGVFIWRKT